MGIERNVRLMAADIAVRAAGKRHFLFLFRIPDGNGDAGIYDGKSIKERGKPGKALFVIRKVQTPGQL